MPKQPTPLRSDKSPAHSRNYYGVESLLASHPEMRRLKAQQAKTRFHGNKNWAASYLLLDYLQDNPLPTHSRVLEPGCGWGLISIYCAKYFAAQVTASDIDPAVLPYLQLHALHNDVEIQWQQAAFDELDDSDFADIDLLIASDICFWDDMADQVFAMIERAVAAGVPRIMIADPLRPPFLSVAERCVDAFFAEFIPLSATTSRQHRGGLLLIENA